MITNRIILIRIAKKAACDFVTLRPGGSTLVVRSDNGLIYQEPAPSRRLLGFPEQRRPKK